MKVFLVGGTGLLGSEAAFEFIRRGHQVTSIALPPIPQGTIIPIEMKLHMANYLDLSDEDIKKFMTG
ncbi:MAG: hypothetical protein KKH01_07200 [Firmicutes bacterium]|nr:hypothetical protein [Bacillota bacterium]